MKLSLLLVACIWVGNTANAQTHFTEREYAREPKWQLMIKDTAVNYIEAEKAYRIYFEHHAKPAGEQEDIGSSPDTNRKMSRKKMRELQSEQNMRIEIKKYERWHQKMSPYVQLDGTILTPTQRLKIWKDNRSGQ